MNLFPRMAEIAREAGALLMEYFQQHVKVEYKGDADLVTMADRKSEILIRERIKARWPATIFSVKSRAWSIPAATIAGTLTRSMAPPTLPMAFRCSAFRWDCSTRTG